MRKHRKLVIGAASIAALALGGTGTALAVGGEDQAVTGSTADQARAVALRYTGGGSAAIVEPDTEAGATYGVEVTKPDGSEVDVRVDSSFRLVNITDNSDG